MTRVWGRFSGPLLYIVLWLIVVWLGYGIIKTHDVRWRGVTRGLPPPMPLASVVPWGTTVALEQYQGAALDDALDELAAMGLVWLRQRLPWDQIEAQPGHYTWDTWDRVINAAAARGFRLVLLLDGAPAWARAEADRHGPAAAQMLAPPADPATFARFAAAVATRYGQRVDFYQVWDEPNIHPHWGLARPIDPAGYAALLAPTAAALRAADQGAVILTAGLAPTQEAGGQNMSEQRFLQGLYAADAAANFDIVALKGFGFWTGADDLRVAEDVLNWGRPIGIREAMVAAGDSATPIWLTEGGWAGLPHDWQGAPAPWGSDSPEWQAARLEAAITRAQTEWPWMGALLVQEFQPPLPLDNPRWGLALRGPNNQRTALGAMLAQMTAAWVPGPGWWDFAGTTIPAATSQPDGVGLSTLTRSPTSLTTGMQFEFRGTRAALGAAIASDIAVRVNGGSPQQMTLAPGEVAEVAHGLPLTRHVLGLSGTGTPTMRVAVGYDEDARVYIGMLGVLALLAIGLAGRGALITWRLPWAVYRTELLALPEWSQVVLLGLIVVLFYTVPNFWLSLALLIPLWLLCVVRLDLGLAATTLASPSSCSPKHYSAGASHWSKS